MKKIFAAVFICIVGAIISMFIYGISDKLSVQTMPVMVTMLSEQLDETDFTYAEDTTVGVTLKTENEATHSYETSVTTPEFTIETSETQNISEEISETVSEINFPLDINTASAEELTNIKGIGTATAEKIISYRENNGYFHSVEELLNVSGIGEKKLENMREFIYVDPEFAENFPETSADTSFEENVSQGLDIFPIELNSATKEELIRINGIGEVTADAIIEYAETIGFNDVSDLLNVKGIGEKKLEKISPYVYVEK